jgi:hypothetical protein
LDPAGVCFLKISFDSSQVTCNAVSSLY